MTDRVLAAALCVAMVMALWGAFLYAPTEKTMGDLQRIFYFHVPSAWVGMLGFFLVFVGSVAYLLTRNRAWDTFAGCAGEVSVFFTTIMLTTGPIWAKPAWGKWWVWDMRLTSALLMWLLYVGYLMLRAYVTEPTKRANLSSVYGVLAFVDVPLVWYAIRWWRTQHPQPVIEQGGMDADMWLATWLCVGALMLLWIYLVRMRMKIERVQQEIESLELAVQTR